MNINITIKQPYINNHTQKTLSPCFFKLHQIKNVFLLQILTKRRNNRSIYRQVLLGAPEISFYTELSFASFLAFT